jgi:hypothetical protein
MFLKYLMNRTLYWPILNDQAVAITQNNSLYSWLIYQCITNKINNLKRKNVAKGLKETLITEKVAVIVETNWEHSSHWSEADNWQYLMDWNRVIYRSEEFNIFKGRSDELCSLLHFSLKTGAPVGRTGCEYLSSNVAQTLVISSFHCTSSS